MSRIAFVMLGLGEAQSRIFDEFSKKLASQIPSAELCRFIEEDSDCRSFEDAFNDSMAIKFDLVVTVGSACTVRVSELMSDKEEGYIPLLFVAVPAVVADEITQKTLGGARFASGVILQSASEYLPLDAVKQLCGIDKKLVIVYRQECNNGHTLGTVESMLSYAKSVGFNRVKTMPIADNRDEFIFDKNDLVIVPRAGVYAQDVDLIEAACQKRGAYFFNGTNGAVPNTAICGYVADVELMGARAFELSEKILIGGEPIAAMPYETLEDTTRVVVNTDMLFQSGVSLPLPGFIFSLDESVQYPVIYQASYPFVLTTMTEYENRLADHMAWLGKDRVPGIQCIPNAIQGLHNTPEHRAWVLKQTMDSRGGPIAVVGGERMAYLVQLEMIKQNKFRSLMIVRSSDDCPRERATVKRKGWPADCFIQRATIEVPSVAVFIDFLQYLQPTVKRIGCVYSYELELMPPHLKKRLAVLKKECRKRGLQFLHAGRGVSNMEFEEDCRSLLKKTDLIVSISDMLRPSDGMFAALACHEENKLFVGSDLDRSDRGGAMFGPQHKLIAQKLVGIVSEVAMGRKPADTSDLFFSAKEYYGWCVNDNWLRMHDLPAVPDTFLVPAYTRVPAIWNPEEPYGGVLRVAHLSVAHWQPPVVKKGPQLIAPLTKEQAEAGFLALLDKKEPKLLE